VGWTFFWMMVVLKVPIAALLYIVFWAIRQTDAEPTGDGDGGIRPPRHPRPPHRPRRRGPHGAPGVAATPRVRRPAQAARRGTQRHP
jgi:hypothetical protein